MASRILELFGYAPDDRSIAAAAVRQNHQCPFIDGACQKMLGDKIPSGVCSLQQKTSGPIICCPYRLYAHDYAVLADVARIAFKGEADLIPGHLAKQTPSRQGKIKVAVFGKRWGKELRLPNRGRSGGYFVDWVLARLNEQDELEEFIAIEVQSIDTTGNYQAERAAWMRGEDFAGSSTAGFNWENVNKRILPQLIYKGHVLRRERLCRNGLFFVCPKPVYGKIRERLGGNLLGYGLQPGSLSLLWYDLGAPVPHGQQRALVRQGTFTTTVDQVALAFTSPSNLPAENVYESAIRSEL